MGISSILANFRASAQQIDLNNNRFNSDNSRMGLANQGANSVLASANKSPDGMFSARTTGLMNNLASQDKNLQLSSLNDQIQATAADYIQQSAQAQMKKDNEQQRRQLDIFG